MILNKTSLSTEMKQASYDKLNQCTQSIAFGVTMTKILISTFLSRNSAYIEIQKYGVITITSVSPSLAQASNLLPSSTRELW